MNVLFVTNVPSPYRVDFFNELGKSVELTVIFERHGASDRDKQWQGDKAQHFTEIYTEDKPIGIDRSVGRNLTKILKSLKFDHLIISGYASPAVMLAIAYCRTHCIPYYIESDGGFNKKDQFPKSILKKFMLRGANGHFVTCEEYRNYLLSLGVNSECIYKYPFTSVKQAEILNKPLAVDEKSVLRKKLGIKEEKIVLSVGQFIHRKGFDVLIEAARKLPDSIGIYFVGGVPTEEYTALVGKYHLRNIHFCGFKDKAALREYYLAADVFVLPTREDIWGLVVNEAMACGLPVITTDRCIAGLELIKNGVNGYIVPVEDVNTLCVTIQNCYSALKRQEGMAEAALQVMRKYTIENMAEVHDQLIKQM